MSSYPASSRPVGGTLPDKEPDEKWGPIPAKWGKAILAILAVAALGAAVVKVTDKEKDVDDAAHGAYKDAKHKAKEVKKDIKDAFK
eukprot:jgi/Botrbrau1/4590/Bobra.60_2s0076.1